MVPLSWYVMLAAAVFCIGVIGFTVRRNILIMFLSIELMLNAVNIALVAFNHYLQDIKGQIFVFFVITVAAAEVAVGLALMIAVFRNKPTTNIDEINLLKG